MSCKKSHPKFRSAILMALLLMVLIGVGTSVSAESGGAEPPVNDPPITKSSTTGSGLSDYVDLLLLVTAVV